MLVSLVVLLLARQGNVSLGTWLVLPIWLILFGLAIYLEGPYSPMLVLGVFPIIITATVTTPFGGALAGLLVAGIYLGAHFASNLLPGSLSLAQIENQYQTVFPAIAIITGIAAWVIAGLQKRDVQRAISKIEKLTERVLQIQKPGPKKKQK